MKAIIITGLCTPQIFQMVNLRIDEIDELVGNPDIHKFSKQFKKSFGVIPQKLYAIYGVAFVVFQVRFK